MRTVDEFRKRQLETLAHALSRPGNCCPTDMGPELFFCALLADLCWLDERGSEWEKVRREYLWGCRGVLGQLQDQPVTMPEYINESTSTWAQVAYVLGYYQPQRLVGACEWTKLNESLDREFFDGEWRESQIHARFGQPSHEVRGGFTTVAAYASDNPAERWIFFDFARRFPKSDEWLADPLLRDVRIERNRFQLLKFGNWCRRSEFNFARPVGRDYLDVGVISIEGDYLRGIAELLSSSGYLVEDTFVVQSGEQAAQELAWRPARGRGAKAGYVHNGWTYVVDPEKALMSNDSLLAFSANAKTKVFGWCCDAGSGGFTLIDCGRRLRDVLYQNAGPAVDYHGGPMVDRSNRLPEESNVDWNTACDEDVLALATRVGAPFDFLADREYRIFRISEANLWSQYG